MRAFVLLFASLSVLVVPVCLASSPNHVKREKPADLIKGVIKDYIEGYYEGNAERVKSALSPLLAKRFVAKTKDGVEVLKDGTAAHFIELTAALDGPKYYPAGKRKLEIKVFEIDGKIASAKAIAQDWVDYIHLCRINGKWVIVNVVWVSK
ncbi:MAG: nuclear transport factor 2 family protein [Armatimonadota bacterium]